MSAVLVTGATGRLGTAVVRRLADAGHMLVLVDRGRDRLAVTFPELASSPRAQLVSGVELGDADAMRGVVTRARDLGGVSALVHCVGAWEASAGALATDAAACARMIERNLTPAVQACGAVVPELVARGGGRVVLVASVDALRGRASAAAYGASKGAVLRYAEALAEEVEPRGVGVCTLLPTTIDSGAGAIAVADVVAFLVSPASAAIRSSTLVLGATA